MALFGLINYFIQIGLVQQLVRGTLRIVWWDTQPLIHSLNEHNIYPTYKGSNNKYISWSFMAPFFFFFLKQATNVAVASAVHFFNYLWSALAWLFIIIPPSLSLNNESWVAT